MDPEAHYGSGWYTPKISGFQLAYAVRKTLGFPTGVLMSMREQEGSQLQSAIHAVALETRDFGNPVADSYGKEVETAEDLWRESKCCSRSR